MIESELPYLNLTPEQSAAVEALFNRNWRDQELADTDYMVPIIDHPQHSDYMAYRVLLRDWPSTEDFPVTRPVVPTGE
jgi:hypothetical protein